MKRFSHKEVYIFNIQDRKLFLDCYENESKRHIVLKLLCYLLNYDKNMQVEQRSEICKRYKPDLISEEHKVWGEAGQIDLEKIVKLGSLNDIEEFHIVKVGYHQTKSLFERYSKKKKVTRTKVFFHCFNSDDIKLICENIYRNNNIQFRLNENNLNLSLNDIEYNLSFNSTIYAQAF